MDLRKAKDISWITDLSRDRVINLENIIWYEKGDRATGIYDCEGDPITDDREYQILLVGAEKFITIRVDLATDNFLGLQRLIIGNSPFKEKSNEENKTKD